MLKIIGLICMIAGGAGAGYSMSVQLGRRYEMLRELQRMAALLMGEISYGNTSLPEGFCSVGRRLRQPLQGFLLELAVQLGRMPQETFAQLFAREAGEQLRNSGLNSQDMENLCRLGATLGYLDREMQLRNLKLYETELVQEIRITYETLPGKKKLYRTMGIMGGLFLVILLL